VATWRRGRGGGPRWYRRRVLPLYGELEALEDLVNTVSGAVWLQHQQSPRFSLLNALNSLESVEVCGCVATTRHLEEGDNVVEERDHRRHCQHHIMEEVADCDEPKGRKRQKKMMEPRGKAAKPQKAGPPPKEEEQCHRRHYDYFVDYSSVAGDSIAAPAIQALFDEVIIRAVPELYFGPELSEIRFPGTGTFFQFRPDPELFTKKFKKIKNRKKM